MKCIIFKTRSNTTWLTSGHYSIHSSVHTLHTSDHTGNYVNQPAGNLGKCVEKGAGRLPATTKNCRLTKPDQTRPGQASRLNERSLSSLLLARKESGLLCSVCWCRVCRLSVGLAWLGLLRGDREESHKADEQIRASFLSISISLTSLIGARQSMW